MLTFSESYTKIAAALLAVHRELQPVVKDKANDLLRSKYATLDAITDYVRPILARADLVLLQSSSSPAPGSIVVETTLLHLSGEWVRNIVPLPVSVGNKGTSEQQALGSTITYGRRYGLSAILGLTTGDDDDGNGGGRGESKQRREAHRAPRVVQEVNATKATTVGDIPFPAVKGCEQYRNQPLREVPTEALSVCYARTKDRTEKKAQMVSRAVEAVLEERRLANDFTTAHPSLGEDA